MFKYSIDFIFVVFIGVVVVVVDDDDDEEEDLEFVNKFDALQIKTKKKKVKTKIL